MALKKCVDAHPEYYGTLSQPAKEEAEQPQKPEEPKEPVEPVEPVESTNTTSELVSPDTDVPQTNPEEPAAESA